jgi:hypothetical protein
MRSTVGIPCLQAGEDVKSIDSTSAPSCSGTARHSSPAPGRRSALWPAIQLASGRVASCKFLTICLTEILTISTQRGLTP